MGDSVEILALAPPGATVELLQAKAGALADFAL
jgi:hypothetical protein